jgi:hypothetical protein
MSYFSYRFYTDDFDQEMLDFVEKKYGLSKSHQSVKDDYLNYGTGNNYFWTCNGASNVYDFHKLTKREFKEIVGMSDKKTFTKADLKDGMVTKYNNGDLRLVLGGSLRGKACGWMSLGDFDDNLSHRTFGWTIAEVFSPKSEYYNLSELFDEGRLVSIWKRPPAKTQTEIELEKLQQQIADLQAQANKLQQTL